LLAYLPEDVPQFFWLQSNQPVPYNLAGPLLLSFFPAIKRAFIAFFSLRQHIWQIRQEMRQKLAYSAKPWYTCLREPKNAPREERKK
jgi:hypothetical protein